MKAVKGLFKVNEGNVDRTVPFGALFKNLPKHENVFDARLASSEPGLFLAEDCISSC